MKKFMRIADGTKEIKKKKTKEWLNEELKEERNKINEGTNERTTEGIRKDSSNNN